MWRRMAMMTACGVHIVTCRGEFTETNIFVNHVFSVLVGLQNKYINETMVSVYLLVHQNKYFT